MGAEKTSHVRVGPSGALLVVLGAALWGSTGTAQAKGPSGVDALAVGGSRIALGAVGLAAVAALRREVGSIRRIGRATLLVGAVGIAAYQLTFFAGVRRAGVAVGTVVGIGSAPAFAGVLGWWRRGEPVRRRWVVSTVLALAGGALLVLAGGGERRVDPWGVVLALGAGLSYAVYALASKDALERVPPAAAMTALFGGGAILLAPLVLVRPLGWITTARGSLMVLHLGLVTVTVAYLLYAAGLRHVALGASATLSLAEPATATILATVVLGERLGATQWGGLALVGAGLALLATGDGG
jgi:DME family drug/metabolite transporter